MKRPVAVGVIMAVSATFSAGCAQIENLIGKATPKAGPSSKPPRPTPALTEAEAERVVAGWARSFNRAGKTYDIKEAEKIETGALLEGHRAEFKISRLNDVRIAPMRATPDLTIPKFTGWPKWFTATMTSKAETRPLDLVIFVQEEQGASWKAASDTVIDQKLAETMGSAVSPPRIGEVVPAGDRSLAITPGRLPAAHAHVARYGTGSRYAGLFGGTVNVAAEYKQLIDAHKLFKKKSWTGRMTVSRSPHPAYVVRTPSGGAVAFYSVDTKAAYKRVKGDIEFSWTSRVMGELYPALIGSEYAEDEITRVERTEYAAYIPPRNTSKIQILASRWTPVSAEGA